jgi:hypothetical protein
MGDFIRTLATLPNAQRIADQRHDEDGRDWAVIDTGDPAQPFRVALYDGQAGAVSLSTSRMVVAQRFVSAAWQRI